MDIFLVVDGAGDKNMPGLRVVFRRWCKYDGDVQDAVHPLPFYLLWWAKKMRM
jgi:hypothetical protein